MNVTYKIKMDLAKKEPVPCLDLVQDDRYSRTVQIGLYVNGIPWQVPQACCVLVRYRKADGIGGVYDTLPDGSRAWEIQDNLLSVRLAPQVGMAVGETAVTVSLMNGKIQLSCFEIRLKIQEISYGGQRSEPYENVRFCLPQPQQARKGEFLRVAEVDAQGWVTALETAAAAAATGGGGISDWNAGEGQPGHVLNRTHWVETVLEDPTFDGDLTGRESMDVSDVFGSEAYIVKVSSRYVSIADMSTARIAFHMSGMDLEQNLSASSVIDMTAVFGVPGTLALLENAMVVLSLPQDVVIMGAPVSAGTWFAYAPGYLYIKALSCLQPAEVEVVHPLDPKFLPPMDQVCTVTITADNSVSSGYVADKTPQELAEAKAKGMVLQCVYDNRILHLVRSNSSVCSFEGEQDSDKIELVYVDIYDTYAQVRVKTAEIPEKLQNPYFVRFLNALAGTTQAASSMTVGNHDYDGSKRIYVKGLPNPYSLTLNGTAYDGSRAVTVNIPALPAVTTADDGAFLRVLNGAWITARLVQAEEVRF